MRLILCKTTCLMLLMLGGILSPLVANDRPDVRKPNIVLIVADDLGWGELGCYGQ